jgi:hypothetical protein
MRKWRSSLRLRGKSIKDKDPNFRGCRPPAPFPFMLIFRQSQSQVSRGSGQELPPPASELSLFGDAAVTRVHCLPGDPEHVRIPPWLPQVSYLSERK